MTSLNRRDLVFLGVVATVMTGLARALFPPKVLLISGPYPGPNLVHYGIYALPVGTMATLAYLRIRKPGAMLILGGAFALMNLFAAGIGIWPPQVASHLHIPVVISFVAFGFWSGAFLAELSLVRLRQRRNDDGPFAQALIGGLFIFGLSFFLPALFALFLLSPFRPFDIVIGVLASVVSGMIGAAGGLLGGKLANQFRRARIN